LKLTAAMLQTALAATVVHAQESKPLKLHAIFTDNTVLV